MRKRISITPTGAKDGIYGLAVGDITSDDVVVIEDVDDVLNKSDLF